MVCSLVSIHFDSPQLSIQNNCINLSTILIQRYAQFGFFRKGSGNSFPPHLFPPYVWFLRKMFVMLCSINWLIFVVWLLYVLRYWTICVLKLFLISLWRRKFWNWAIFLIKPFLCMTKKSRQEKYFDNEKSFQGEIKSIFHRF